MYWELLTRKWWLDNMIFTKLKVALNNAKGTRDSMTQLRWHLALGAALAGLAVLAGCGGSSNNSATTVSSFEPGACPTSQAAILAKLGASCGYLVVPENRTKANGRTIRLPVAIVPSKSKPPAPDPIVHLTGGPGGDALSEAQTLVDAGLNANRKPYHHGPARGCGHPAGAHV
jgi:hypothetical protein